MNSYTMTKQRTVWNANRDCKIYPMEAQRADKSKGHSDVRQSTQY